MNAFPDRLKYFRAKAGFTQKELADKVGISPKQISDYEVGTSTPRQATFVKLLDALNVDEHTFLKTQFINLSNANSEQLAEDEIAIPVKNLSEGNVVHIRKSVLIRLGCNIDKIEALIFYSNILAPHINDGDIILIDKSKQDIHDGKIYAIDINQTLYFRLIHSTLDGQIILSTTTGHIPMETNSRENVPIYGRVIYRQGFL
ncbi:hypothetical protein F959_01641 [Acinetobacter venetianus RAG-1 = CIP 110063]|uniref:HTH cro/C1-type domain-containing protein n=1 Tax=Acinetobacter venetianus (strain ATCC 31012 / DSM 23050 / BCRC 14357 / CCUG 45561 / CIP 110063 / KCTC 2702 / LMG 19082 / RAG-1) TaxID=1191460 RepID=N8ZST7_ACIVR|nr:LexA family transcriptional regulator [Acinetobacter venetianus]ENV36834.1 hypothetical protein F959_01641 [Acinetobacter venetianus RAG-1 = CIP 110063]